MQTYSNLYRIKVTSNDHGERVFLLAAHSIEDALGAVPTLASPWLRDETFSIALWRMSENTLIAVTERAYKGE